MNTLSNDELEDLRRQAGINGDTDPKWRAADEIERLLALLRLICAADRKYEVFDCPTGGAIRIELQRIINQQSGSK